MLLILDLDETLVFASTSRLNRAPDFEVGDYSVYCRPGLADFLRFVYEHFQVAVWSSSGAEYAKHIVERISSDSCNPQFLWARERCTARINPETREPYYVKDLKKVKRLGYDLEQILIIDDSPEKIERNYGNHLRVRPYEGSTEDNELLLLMRYLEYIKGQSQIRSIEKRNWRQEVTGG